MAYIKTIWKDRLVERPNTFEVQENPDGTITLIPQPGVITEQGTSINAANLNNIENGIEGLDNALATHQADIAPQDISTSFTRVVGTGGSIYARYIPYLNMVWLSFNITGISEDTSSSTTIITFDTKYAPVTTIRGVVRSPSTSGLGNGQISIASGSISVNMDSNQNTLRGVYTWFTA